MFSRSWPLGVALVHLHGFLHISKALALPCDESLDPACHTLMDPDEFATIMTCENANSSFKLFGQSIYFDWSNDKGFQWGNIEGFWGKDKNSGKKGWRFEVALLKEEFNIWGPFGPVVEAKFGTWPITFIVEWEFEIKFDLPTIYSCNTWWGNLLSDNPVAGVYLKPLTFWKTPGFGDAGMPQRLPPYRTVEMESGA